MVKIIRSIKELQKIESEWNSLAESSPNENVFMSFDWNFLWIKYFLRRKDRLFIIAVYNDANENELEALAPFFLKRFCLFFKSLMFVSGDYSDYLNIIVKKGADKERIYSEIFGEIIKNNGADMIYLRQVSAELLNGVKKNVSEHFGLKLNYKESGGCYYFNLPDSIDAYMMRFNSKQRYNILSRVEKAEKNNIRFIGSSDFDKSLFKEYLNYFFGLHQKRWNDKGKKGVFYNKKIKFFFTDLFTVLYNKNKIALSFLAFDKEAGGGGGHSGGGGIGNGSGGGGIGSIGSKKIISSAVCFDSGNKRQVYLPGFDPEYSNFHPGIVLTYYIIKEAIGCKFEEFDFLKGGEEYKQRFGAVKRENYKLYSYKNKIIYYIFKFSLFIENEIKEKLKDLAFKIKRFLIKRFLKIV